VRAHDRVPAAERRERGQRLQACACMVDRSTPALEEEPLDAGRKAIAWLSLALFVATFVPVPISF